MLNNIHKILRTPVCIICVFIFSQVKAQVHEQEYAFRGPVKTMILNKPGYDMEKTINTTTFDYDRKGCFGEAIKYRLIVFTEKWKLTGNRIHRETANTWRKPANTW